jgi:hypothetical protein
MKSEFRLNLVRNGKAFPKSPVFDLRKDRGDS